MTTVAGACQTKGALVESFVAFMYYWNYHVSVVVSRQ